MVILAEVRRAVLRQTELVAQYVGRRFLVRCPLRNTVFQFKGLRQLWVAALLDRSVRECIVEGLFETALLFFFVNEVVFFTLEGVVDEVDVL